MSYPVEPSSPTSMIWIPNSVYSSSLLESYAHLNEKLNVNHHVRRVPVRHRAGWLLLSMTAAGMLFANFVWSIAPRHNKPDLPETTQAHTAWDLNPSGQERVQLPDNVRVVALVSYNARSRTSILDCYLQSNLAINDGLLDQVIFTPKGHERDMDWLYALVESTPGYYMLGKPKHDNNDDANTVPIMGAPDAQVSEQDAGTGSFARAWNLALSESQTTTFPADTQTDEPSSIDSAPQLDPSRETIYVFIHGETVFLAHDAISKLLQTHLSHNQYAVTHANVVNQPVLSWIHHHLGVVRPYRPEVEPPIRAPRNRTSAKQQVKQELDAQHSWRASELPLWRGDHRSKDAEPQTQATDDTPSDESQGFSPTEGPSLFGIPVDFHSPFRGHRWLPYHPEEKAPLSKSQPGDVLRPAAPELESNAGSISTPVTQAMMSLQRPGRWPWTLSALHLYSFLEHLECTPPHSLQTTLAANETSGSGKYKLNCMTAGDLTRYNMGHWEYQTEKYGMSLFAISSGTIAKIGAMPNGVSESEIIQRSGKGAVIDGGSMAVRFVGSVAGTSDAMSEMRGLESTDLLRRFEAVGREMGGCDGSVL